MPPTYYPPRELRRRRLNRSRFWYPPDIFHSCLYEHYCAPCRRRFYTNNFVSCKACCRACLRRRPAVMEEWKAAMKNPNPLLDDCLTILDKE